MSITLIIPYLICKGGVLMDLGDLINLIANVGFPVAISAYLLIRLEKQIITLTYSINKLNTIVSLKLGTVIEDDEFNKKIS